MGLKHFIRNLRETINLSIYSSKNIALTILRAARMIVSTGMIGLMVYYYGFPQTDASIETITFIFRSSFVFFLCSFLVRIFFDFEPAKFIRNNRLEAILLLVILLDMFSKLFLGLPLFRLLFNQIESDDGTELFSIFTQFYLLLIVLIEFGRASRKLTLIRLSPPLLFILSFVVLIFTGTLLLLLPECHAEGMELSFMDALFTSTSASCVTGLTVVDTATFFTMKGKLILMLLIQLGGLNVISFASFFAAFGGKGVSLRHKLLVKDSMSYDSLYSTSSLLKRVILMTFFIELAGAVTIFFTWSPEIHFVSVENRIFHSVFHAISAFNNSGFSTYTNNMYEPLVRDSYLLHLTIAGLVFLGGLGVPIMTDMFSIRAMRERMKHPWKKLQVTTRLSLYMSLILIVIGAVGFFVFERANYKQYMEGGMNTLDTFGQAVMSIFHSVITRTAGFNSVDINILTSSTWLLFIFLMFVGASSGGTGGGIKTSTFAVILLSAVANIRGKKNVEVFRHNIPQELVQKALSIFIFSLSVVFVGVLILSVTDPEFSTLQLMVEEVSAFSTVGLTDGVTSNLSHGGKTVIMITMLIGRVGVLTLAYAISTRVITNNYKYTDANITLG